MCNCPTNKPDQTTPKPAEKPKSCNVELSPQVEPEEQRLQRQKNTCLPARRTLTFEDDSPGDCREEYVTATSTPGLPLKSTIRDCDLSGVAVVRRRVDPCKSPEADGRLDTPRKDDPEKTIDVESPEKGEDSEKAGDETKESEASPDAEPAAKAPCPGKSNPEKECTC